MTVFYGYQHYISPSPLCSTLAYQAITTWYQSSSFRGGQETAVTQVLARGGVTGTSTPTMTFDEKLKEITDRICARVDRVGKAIAALKSEIRQNEEMEKEEESEELEKKGSPKGDQSGKAKENNVSPDSPHGDLENNQSEHNYCYVTSGGSWGGSIGGYNGLLGGRTNGFGDEGVTQKEGYLREEVLDVVGHWSGGGPGCSRNDGCRGGESGEGGGCFNGEENRGKRVGGSEIEEEGKGKVVTCGSGGRRGSAVEFKLGDEEQKFLEEVCKESLTGLFVGLQDCRRRKY